MDGISEFQLFDSRQFIEICISTEVVEYPKTKFVAGLEAQNWWDCQINWFLSRSLSGGQKRHRYCEALVNKPEVLISDEATSALDLLRRRYRLVIKEINKKSESQYYDNP